VSRISGDGEKCLRNGAEEYVVHNGRVLRGERNETPMLFICNLRSIPKLDINLR
jgi:hypothetical protein